MNYKDGELLGKIKVKNRDKIASRFRKRPRTISTMINVYNVLCDSCKIYVRLNFEKGENIEPSDFCEDCQDKVMPLLKKVKEKLEK